MAKETQDVPVPTLQDLHNVTRHEAGVATKWFELGVVLLDSNSAVLEIIKTSQQSDDDRCNEMFKKWLQMKTDASWSRLVTALMKVGLNAAAHKIRCSKIANKVDEEPTSMISAPVSMLTSPEEASVEFGVIVGEFSAELEKNKVKNLEKLKSVSCFLTLKDNPTLKVFNDAQIEAIQACDSISFLLNVKLGHCYRRDDYSMLKILMSSLNATKSLKLLEKFETKIDEKMRLQQIAEQYSDAKISFPDGYDKMVAIIRKDFSSITRREYNKLKEFTSLHCGVEKHIISPVSKAVPFNSLLLEWFISVSVVSHMIETAKSNVDKFTEEMFVYLRISSTVIFDHKDNQLDWDQLLEAVRIGNIVTVERLINTRYIDVNATFGWSMTALHLAANNGHAQVIETLIRSGADVNALNEEKETPLHLAANNGHIQVVERLIRSGADVNAVGSWDKQTALHNAAARKHLQVLETLVKLGADVNALDKEKQTALHYAAKSGFGQGVATLIRLGADVNARDEDNDVPLQIALEWGHTNVVQFMVVEAKVDTKQLDQSTKLQIERILEQPSHQEGQEISSGSSPKRAHSSGNKSSGYSSTNVRSSHFSSTSDTGWSSGYDSTTITKLNTTISHHTSTTVMQEKKKHKGKWKYVPEDLFSQHENITEEQRKNIVESSSKQYQTLSHNSEPISLSSTTKQSNTITDHTSTTGESGTSSHGLEMKQKEEERFIKSSDDNDDDEVVDTSTNR